MDICEANFLESNKQLELDISDDFSLFDSSQELKDDGKEQNFEELGTLEEENQEEVLKLELKTLLEGLKYAFLGDRQTYPVVISSSLTSDQEGKLLTVLREHKLVIGWTLKDIKGINPLICTYIIHLEDNTRIYRQPQRKLTVLREHKLAIGWTLK